MSSETKRPYTEVRPIAEQLRSLFAPHCERIEISGSLRREKFMIGDIELVCIPKVESIVQGGLFDSGTTVDTFPLYQQMDGLITSEKIVHIEPQKWGKKYRAFEFIAYLDNDKCGMFKVDMFIQPDPATWGINYMIRTGSSDFSRKMVTPKMQGGYMPNSLRIDGARVQDVNSGKIYDTPTEQSVFDLYGMDYVVPSARL